MSQAPLNRPKTSFWQKVVLILSGIFLCLVLLEMGLRLGGFVYSAMNPLPEDKNADYRVLCIGESTTFGLGASNPRLFNYPHQLELLFRERFPHLKVQVFHDGRIGSNTTENLMKLPSQIEKYKPQLVIFMVGINNWWNLDKSNILIFNKKKGFSEGILKAAVFMDQFRVYKLLKSIAYSAGIIKLNMSMPEAIRPKKDLSVMDAKEAKQYTRTLIDYHRVVFNICDQDIFSEVAFYDLREMVSMCQKRRIKTIISGYPASTENERVRLAQERVARLFNCPFVDNRAVFKLCPEPFSYFSNDKFHPNDKGYRLLAENILRCILDNHLMTSQGLVEKKASGLIDRGEALVFKDK